MTEKKRLTVSFSHKIANQLEDLAKDQGLTKSGLLTVLISKEIERKESEQKNRRIVGDSSLDSLFGVR